MTFAYFVWHYQCLVVSTLAEKKKPQTNKQAKHQKRCLHLTSHLLIKLNVQKMEV